MVVRQFQNASRPRAIQIAVLVCVETVDVVGAAAAGIDSDAGDVVDADDNGDSSLFRCHNLFQNEIFRTGLSGIGHLRNCVARILGLLLSKSSSDEIELLHDAVDVDVEDEDEAESIFMLIFIFVPFRISAFACALVCDRV